MAARDVFEADSLSQREKFDEVVIELAVWCHLRGKFGGRVVVERGTFSERYRGRTCPVGK